MRESGVATRFFSQQDLPHVHPSLATLTAWFKRLSLAARTAEHPFNASLMLEALSSEASQTLRASAARTS
jgi:DNA polymerase-3 subunit delta'